MSLVMPVLRSVVRDELAEVQPLTLAAVTDVVSNADGSGARNVEINARIHGSDLELQRVPVMTGRVGMSCAPRVGDTAVLAFLGAKPFQRFAQVQNVMGVADRNRDDPVPLPWDNLHEPFEFQLLKRIPDRRFRHAIVPRQFA